MFRPTHRLVLTLVALMPLLAATPAVAQQTAQGQRFAVASGHPAATEAGLAVLRDGGNAVDAAVAVSMALGVAEPYGSGLGGKLIFLYRAGETGQVHYLEALCESPAGTDREAFKALDRDERRYGWHAVSVPGLPAGIHEAHRRWGSRPWAGLLQPAIELAERGVTVTPKAQVMYEPKVQYLARDPEAARLYLVDDGLPPVGAVLRSPDLAQSLRRLAADGPEALYRGPIGRAIVEAAQAHGSPLTMDDLAAFRPTVTRPLASDYRGYTVYTCPPPLTGGITVLAALEAIEAHDWDELGGGPRGAAYLDAVGRALLCVYPAVSEAVADVPEARTAAEAMLTDEAVAALRRAAAAIDPAHPKAEPLPAGAMLEPAGESRPDASTTHFVVADGRGNVVSVTQSLSYHFGASVIAPGTGILLNNSMNNFSVFTDGAANLIAPRKRARSTIAPMIVTRGGEPVLAMGIPGGQRIPTTTIQSLTDVLDFGLSFEQSFALPRYHLRRPISSSTPPNQVDLEATADPALDAELTARGWLVERHEPDGRYFGGGNAVVYTPTGGLVGTADKRRTNHAAAE